MCNQSKKKPHRARFEAGNDWPAKLKTECQWAFHNVVIHPIMTVFDVLHVLTGMCKSAAAWVHDWSAPELVTLDGSDVEGDDEAAEEEILQQLEDEQRAILEDADSSEESPEESGG